MKVIYKEKSLFDQDIEIYNEFNLLIAQINYGTLGYVLHYEGEEYYMMTKGWFGLNESIIRIKDKIEYISIRSQYDIPSTSKLSENEEIYLYEESSFLGRKYKFLNIKNEVLLSGNQTSFFTNNGFIVCEDKINILTDLFLILIRLNRNKILLNVNDQTSLEYVIITNHFHR